ncbi:MAG: ASKHA domain-containing protein [Candidatus Brocadiales bacterium]|nr:ASKHA domain-containing protein [Candidatus Brocadiales bacterium]
MQEIEITFYPIKISGRVPKGITILEAARRLGVNIEGPCGGTGRCGKDLVQIRINKTLGTVLACMTIVETELEVIIPSNEKKTLKIVEGFYAEGDKKHNINPSVRKEVIHNGQGLCSTQVYVNDKLFSTEEGNTKSEIYGIALDIGTTTLVASLVSLCTGEVLNSSSTLNPLVYYGHDVMSRIKYSVSHKDGLLRMHHEIVSAINVLIHRVTTESGVLAENIYQVMAAGNTTMQHIFLNKEIKGLGEYPYKTETLDAVSLPAKELGVCIPEFAVVTTFPGISAYVGGDIVSGLVAIYHLTMNRKTDLSTPTPFCEGKELPALFLDIGTNGELALLLNDRMVTTSTAAGPCFEGMTISSGMRAGEGAIEHVHIGDELLMDVIGNCPPRGICGSGLLDIVSELLRVGLVNSRGRLQGKEGLEIPEKYRKYLFEKNGKRHFRLTDDVSISQEDIRQVQLAKAAIRSGIEILLAECNIKPEELKTVIIAGAFGYHLNEESLFRTGFLPELKEARLLYVGNSSLEGAIRMLLNKELISKAVHIAKTTQVMELSQIPEFESVFVREMHF